METKELSEDEIMQDKIFVDLDNDSNERLLAYLFDNISIYRASISNVGIRMVLCNILMLIGVLLTRALGCTPENLKEKENDNANANSH